MPVELPARPRYQVTERVGEISFTIPSRRYWFVILFLSFWLCGWAVGEVMVASGLVLGAMGGLGDEAAGLGAGAFLLIWLTFWTIGGLAALYFLLWQLVGREIITIDGLVLRIQRGLPFWMRTREYRLEDVKDLRMPPAVPLPWPFGAQQASAWPMSAQAGWLAFDYGAKTIRFGLGLEEAEAKMLLAEIGKRYPSLLATE